MRKKKLEGYKWYKDEGLFFFLSSILGTVLVIIFWLKDKFFQ